jgi:hypothetical protein
MALIIKKMDNNINKYFALCAPSLGFLDNLLPILHDLKVKDADCSISLIIPRAFDVDQLRKNNQFIKVSSNIFDRVLFRKHAGTWGSELSLKSLSKREKSSVMLHAIYGFYRKIRRLPWFSYFLNNSEVNSALSLNKILNIDDSAILFYDIRFEGRAGVKEFIDIFNNNLKVSINHGTALLPDMEMSRDCSIGNRRDVLALAISKKEVKPYIDNFNICRENIILSGIPRHDLEWIKIMKNSGLFINPFSNKKYVLIVSRRLKGKFKDKVRILKQIRDYIMLEKGIPVLIKLHPTERSSALDYKVAFGINNYGKSWRIIDSHVFHLSKNCKFAITFYSGLCLDMLMDNIPTIEYLPIRHKINNPSVNNVYRYYGVVHVARNFLDFKQGVDTILDDKKILCKDCLNNYKDIYSYPVNNNSVINRILTARHEYKKGIEE